MGQQKIVAVGASASETAAYGKFLGIRLRHIANKDTMKSQAFGVTEIHYLPGWNKRRDRHAIASEINHIRRSRRKAPLVEKHIIRLVDGTFVDQDYRGPELEAVADTQKTQIDGLRQMHARDPEPEGAFGHYNIPEPASLATTVMDEFEKRALDDIQDAMEEHDADIVHLPQTIDAEEAAEEQGIDPATEEFFDFLDRKD